MKNLPTLLERFSKLLNKKELAKESAASVIKDKTGINIAPENISIKDTTLEITASPGVKSEIMFKSELILSELKESRGMHLSRILYK
jgi:hypothetical protein